MKNKNYQAPLRSLPMILTAACLVFLTSQAWAGELSSACARGEILAVRELLEGGADPNETDEEGYTPLLRTVFAGVSRPLSMHLRIADLLTVAGADVNAAADVLPPGSPGLPRTAGALHRTVREGAAFLELTMLLLENGADPNMPGAWGSPLHVAAGSEKAGLDEVKLLLAWGADASALNQWGVEPLAEAVTAENPSLEKIALLLEAGADVDAVFDWDGHNGINALMAAAMNGTSQVVELMLDNGARKYSVSGDGLTPYDYAVMGGRSGNAFLLY